MFTAPRVGVYLITFSYKSSNDADESTYADLHHNGGGMSETEHQTRYLVHSGQKGSVQSTGGRAVYQKLEAGDTLTLFAYTVDGDMFNILFCVQFINN